MSYDKEKALFTSRPKEELGFFPTPFYKLEKLSKKLGINLYIKRDDFTGKNLFGGNKVRKLEYLIGDAKAQGCDYVFTYGATQSNHAMETASACCTAGLKCVLYLTAFVDPDENDYRANLLLDKILGAEIHIVKPEGDETENDAQARSFELAKAQIAKLEAEGHKCYNVPVGGSTFVGSAAFAKGYVELQEQLDQAGVHADYIVHCTGSGGTMAGIVAGHKLVNSDAKIVSINAFLPADNYIDLAVEHANDALAWVGSDVRVNTEDFNIDLGYYLPGYEQPSEGGSEAIRMLAREEGIFLDPVYTGKAFAGLLDYVRTGKIPQGSNVVFWHTGGAMALFSEKEILGDIF